MDIIPTHGIKVQPGDVYICNCNIGCRSGFVHRKGSKLRVVDSTRTTPHNERTDTGVQWVCQTESDVSVWATLESSIHRGLFSKETE